MGGVLPAPTSFQECWPGSGWEGRHPTAPQNQQASPNTRSPTVSWMEAAGLALSCRAQSRLGVTRGRGTPGHAGAPCHALGPRVRVMTSGQAGAERHPTTPGARWARGREQHPSYDSQKRLRPVSPLTPCRSLATCHAGVYTR